MKNFILKVLCVLVVAFSAETENMNAQCTGCTFTVSSGSAGYNLGAGQKLCVTGAYTGSVNFNGSGASVCIATGASWTPSSFNVNNSPTIDIYGTLSLNSSLSNTATINVKNGGLLSVTTSSFDMQNGAKITVESGGQLETTGKLNMLGSSTKLTVNSGGTALINTSGSQSVGLENNDSGGLDIQGNVTITNEFYNHGAAIIGAGAVVTTTSLRSTYKGAGKSMENNGTINVNGNATVEGDMGGTGNYIITGNLTIPSNGQLNGGYWQVGGTSIFTDGNCTGQISASVTFYDETSSNGGDFDSGCDDVVQGYTVQQLLPVQLIDFDYVDKGNDRIQFQWLVAEEANFSHYELQKAQSSNEFNTIEKIALRQFDGAGVKTYLSKVFEKGEGHQYFRIKMVDLDGSFEYSPVITIKGEKKTISVYPNPVDESGKVIIEKENEEPIILNIFTTEGKLVQKAVLSGQLRYERDLSNLDKSQMYIFEIVSGYETHNFKIFVK